MREAGQDGRLGHLRLYQKRGRERERGRKKEVEKKEEEDGGRKGREKERIRDDNGG